MDAKKSSLKFMNMQIEIRKCGLKFINMQEMLSTPLSGQYLNGDINEEMHVPARQMCKNRRIFSKFHYSTFSLRKKRHGAHHWCEATLAIQTINVWPPTFSRCFQTPAPSSTQTKPIYERERERELFCHQNR